MLIPVVTADQMRALDRAAIEDYGIPSLVLMERAGQGVFERLCRWFAPIREKRVAVVCGKGNNGGDGLVIARYLWEAGASVQVFLTAPPDEFRGDAAVQWRIVEKLDIPTSVLTPPVSEPLFSHFDVLLDALLGTGTRGEVQGILREVIEAINYSGLPVVAVDIPSGLDSDTGHALGIAVRATYTVTMGLPKRGFFLADGVRHIGHWEIAEIGIPQKAVQSAQIGVCLLTDSFVRSHLPKYPPDAHKGNRGHLLVVGGSLGLTGAPALAGISALRAGAGLVTVAVPARIQPVVASFYPELMTLSLPDGDTGTLTPTGVESLLNQIERFDGMLLGPGLSQAEPVRESVRLLLEAWQKPILIDADGLNALAYLHHPTPSPPHPLTNAVLTPHPGEAARLLGISTKEVQSDRLGALDRLQEKFGCTVVLKGAYTLIGQSRIEGEKGGMGEWEKKQKRKTKNEKTETPNSEIRNRSVWICPFAEPALGTGGSGDVHSGVIGGLLVQGLEPSPAAAVGTYLHAAAGVYLKQSQSRPFTAEELSRALSIVCKKVSGLGLFIFKRYIY